MLLITLIHTIGIYHQTFHVLDKNSLSDLWLSLKYQTTLRFWNSIFDSTGYSSVLYSFCCQCFFPRSMRWLPTSAHATKGTPWHTCYAKLNTPLGPGNLSWHFWISLRSEESTVTADWPAVFLGQWSLEDFLKGQAWDFCCPLETALLNLLWVKSFFWSKRS